MIHSIINCKTKPTQSKKNKCIAVVLGVLALNVLAEVIAAEQLPLFTAATAGKLDKVKVLLGQGADVNAKSESGRTALMGAAFNGNEKIIRSLLAFGAQVNEVDSRGNSALMDAALMGHSKILKLLLAVGADPNLKDNGGQSALKKAELNGQQEIVSLLVEAGAVQEAEPDAEKKDDAQ